MKVKLTVGTVTGLKLNTTYVHRRYTWADQLIVKLAVFVSKSYNHKLHKKEMAKKTYTHYCSLSIISSLPFNKLCGLFISDSVPKISSLNIE